VDRERIRYGFFSPQGSEIECREFHSEPLVENLFQSGPLGGPVRDLDHLGAALATLLRRISIVPSEASLVLPDAWVRVAFAEFDEPPSRANRADILRFKLSRLVPFRVEELRITGVELPAIDGSLAGRRLLLGFGVEALLRQLEEVFSEHGVALGHICNESLSLLPMVAPLLEGGSLALVAHVTPQSYALVVTESGRPVLHRFKVLGAGRDLRARLVPKDLRLTRKFLQRELTGRRFGELVLVASEEESEQWKAWLSEAFERNARSLVDEWPLLPGTASGVASWDAAALLGAASREVA
jgi:hypothetical protein